MTVRGRRPPSRWSWSTTFGARRIVSSGSMVVGMVSPPEQRSGGPRTARRLAEVDVRAVVRPVGQQDDELAARAGPRLRGLPLVRVATAGVHEGRGRADGCRPDRRLGG